MLKWLQTLSKTKQRVIYISAILISILSFCLIIASIAHDGYNEFAKAFYIYKQEPITDPRWEQFSKIAQEKKIAPEIVQQIKELYGTTFYTEVEQQNALGFGFFIATMTLLFAICLMITSSLSYVSIGLIKYNIHTAYRENMIPEEEFTQLLNIFELIEINERKNKKKALAILNEAIQEEEQKEQNNEEE